MRTNTIKLGLLVFITVGLAARAAADGGCCAHCGCQASCQKVCRLVCEEKKVPVTCWGCKCEDFCLPGHSKVCCEHCEMVCDEPAADCDAPCTHAKKFVWKEWIPGCASLHTKKKLMKRTVTKKVPSYKWVVEDLCCDCQARTEAAAVLPPGAIESPALVAATIGDDDIAPASFYAPADDRSWIKSLLPAWRK